LKNLAFPTGDYVASRPTRRRPPVPDNTRLTADEFVRLDKAINAFFSNKHNREFAGADSENREKFVAIGEITPRTHGQKRYVRTLMSNFENSPGNNANKRRPGRGRG